MYIYVINSLALFLLHFLFYKYKNQGNHYYNKENLLNDWFIVEGNK